MIKISKTTIEILDKIAYLGTTPSDYEAIHLKLEKRHLEAQGVELDISELIILQIIGNTNLYYDDNDNIYKRGYLLNALKGALFLLNKANYFTSAGRELYTINHLTRHGEFIETLTAIRAIMIFYRYGLGDEKQAFLFLHSLFKSKEDIEYIEETLLFKNL